MAQPTTKDLESVIRKIKGVQACRVVEGKEKTIGEIRVLAADGKAPKSIVRDVVGCLSNTYGMNIDYRVVSVVQVEDSEDALAELLPGTNRVSIKNVEVNNDGVSVTLSRRKTETTGHDANKDDSLATAAANATLEALQSLDERLAKVELEHAHIAVVDERKWAVVSVLLPTNTGFEVVGGSAIVRDLGEATAVARAILDATNRRIARRG